MKEAHRVAAKVFVTCWVVYSLHWTPHFPRELFPALTLAEQGTLNVEQFAEWSPDIFRGPRGGAYINNNPGASLVGAIPLVVARPILHVIERWNQTEPPPIVSKDLESWLYRRAVAERREWYFLAICFVSVAGLMAPLSALTAAALALLLVSGGVSRRRAIVVALVYAFGTPVFLRTGYLNHNLLVGHAALFGFLALRTGSGGLVPWRVLTAGLLGGAAILCDYSGMVVLGTLGAYALARAGDVKARPRWKALALYTAGAVPGLLALLAYQSTAFGTPTLPAQHYMTATDPTVRGYRGFDWPSLDLFWPNFFDPRFGLFVYCPLLALALAAPFTRRARHRVPRRETMFILAFFGLFVLFCAANQYSRLQWTTGFRYLVPVVPGLLVLSLQVLQLLPNTLRAALLIFTVAEGWLIAALHANPSDAIASVVSRGIRLAWVNRLYELGLMERPLAASLAVLVFSGVLVCLVFRSEFSREKERQPVSTGVGG